MKLELLKNQIFDYLLHELIMCDMSGYQRDHFINGISQKQIVLCIVVITVES